MENKEKNAGKKTQAHTPCPLTMIPVPKSRSILVALGKLQRRPKGFGLRRLCRVIGLPPEDVEQDCGHDGHHADGHAHRDSNCPATVTRFAAIIVLGITRCRGGRRG